jgi:hypothetical protein
MNTVIGIGAAVLVAIFILIIFLREQYAKEWKWARGCIPSPDDKSNPLRGEYYKYLLWNIGKIRKSIEGLPSDKSEALILDFFQRELSRVRKNRPQADLLLELIQCNFEPSRTKMMPMWHEVMG